MENLQEIIQLSEAGIDAAIKLLSYDSSQSIRFTTLIPSYELI